MKNIILEELMSNRDEEYALFQAKLIPGKKQEKVIGVRVPIVRKIAKKYWNTDEGEKFIKKLPHDYYDEDMLHAAMISEEKDYDKCMDEVKAFLPYVDNWAVCDTLLPKAFKIKKSSGRSNKEKLLEEAFKMMESKETYTCRYGIGIIMRYFLDEDYNFKYLEVVSKIKSDEYYINMMIAWCMATALAKQWDDTISIIESNKMDTWVHNKAIQKALESYRITPQQKDYLRTLKRRG